MLGLSTAGLNLFCLQNIVAPATIGNRKFTGDPTHVHTGVFLTLKNFIRAFLI
jgi:hypothetical protein